MTRTVGQTQTNLTQWIFVENFIEKQPNMDYWNIYQDRVYTAPKEQSHSTFKMMEKLDRICFYEQREIKLETNSRKVNKKLLGNYS
jgi:hypothetical protein